ncbi:MAG: hypothetical protein WCT49_05335 [Candidatus Paceibacterota bacterium]|jgi:hypothetical protein|nr:hypothetical protein [Candidatus Paceibacterota bacterium]
MPQNFEKKESGLACMAIKTALGTMFVIIGSGILRYLGLLTVMSFILVAVSLIIYGIFFDHKLTDLLEKILSGI